MEEQKEIPKKGKGTGVLWAIIIILVILLGGCLYLLTTKDTKENSNKPTTPETNDKTETKTEPLQNVDLEDPLVIEVNDMLPTYPCAGTALELNQKDKDIEEFTNLEKLNIMLAIYANPIIKTAADYSDYTISESELNKYFDDLSFLDEYRPAIDSSTKGNGVPSHDGAKIAGALVFPSYIRFNDNNITITAYGFGCEGPGNNGGRIKLYKAEKNSEQIVLSYTYYYQEVLDFDDSKNTFVFNFYKAEGAQSPIETTDEPSLDKTKYDTYQFTFNIKDGNRKLQSVKYIPVED